MITHTTLPLCTRVRLTRARTVVRLDAGFLDLAEGPDFVRHDLRAREVTRFTVSALQTIMRRIGAKEWP